jgi:trehalose 6-phosphate synthase
MSTTTIAQSHEPLIIIASNRGPFSFERLDDGSFQTRRGAGGLVTALSALAQQHEVLWVAAALSEDDRAWAVEQGSEPVMVEGIRLRLLVPDPDAYEQYYNQIANPLLWFIQHQLWDTPRSPSIDGDTWNAWHHGYQAINRQFAETICECVAGAERPLLILPQDYHLYTVVGLLRERLGEKVQIQPFCHIPWPGPDAWRILPAAMRDSILSSLLAADRVGFQTDKDAFNFVHSCRFYLPDAHAPDESHRVRYRGREVIARAYPISVDSANLNALLADPETTELREALEQQLGGARMILRSDRVEPSKNILRSLQAFRLLLERYPEHLGNVQMLTLLAPSRMEVGEYQTYLKEITAEGALINADFSDGRWEPVRIIVGSNYLRVLAAMQLYDVLMVTPLADGMNLVAKEGPVVNQHHGVLVLSEYAGAYYELGEHALTVSPFDIHSTAETLHRALHMPETERRQRAEGLRRQIRQADIRRWFENQVEDALRGQP